MATKIISLNVERDAHLLQVKDFIKRESPDIVALMEVKEDNLDELLPDHKYRVFVPSLRLVDGVRLGVVVASSEPFSAEDKFYCDRLGPDYLPGDGPAGCHRPGVVVVRRSGVMLAATHFTWTSEGSVTEEQTKHLQVLLKKLKGRELVLVGDFNIPRGNSNYQLLTERYKDNIPAEIISTIDWELHRAKREGKKKIELVVDYVWSTPAYVVEELRIVEGISDHKGLVASIIPC